MTASRPAVHSLAPDPSDLPEPLRVFLSPDRLDTGAWANPWGVNVEPELSRLWKWKTGKNAWAEQKRARKLDPKVEGDPAGAFASLPEGARVSWMGHASALVEVDGVRVLIDPVLGSVGGFLRRKAPAAWALDALPRIDAVLVSHGHYDHLDRNSLRLLARRFGPELLFVLPRGLAGSLPADARRSVVELSWWEAVTLRGVDLCLVPAQHWHRRGPGDTNRALWGGWVVRGGKTVYHSGDTGYFGGFSAIGEVFPDIDLAVLPVGAWAPRWFMADQHMDPDHSVQAFADLRARRFLAMHWGTFDLTDEPVDEGPQEMLRAVERAGAEPSRFLVLPHGGSVPL